MMRLTPLFSIVLLGMSVAAAHGAAPGNRPIDFNRDVRPLLSDRCFACHGPDATHAKGDLRLDIDESAYGKGTKSGKPAIVPGDAAASELVRRIFTSDEDDRMPPSDSHKKLDAKERAILKRWVDAFTTTSPADAQFMNSCQYVQMKSEKECKETLKRNKKFINEMN